MAFTEFYCDATNGANINAGDNTANGVVTATNGNWSTATNVFAAASGTPFSGVTVGEFASVYLDGATVAVYIGRVTAVNGGGTNITISSTAKSGTAPTTGATGRSCTTGGAWLGPNAASGFPFTFVGVAMVNTAADQLRINMKNNSTYNITAAISASVPNIVIQGYTSAADDGGRFTLDGGTSGASYTLLTLSGTGIILKDAILQNNGATGSLSGLLLSGNASAAVGVVVNSVRGLGINLQSGGGNRLTGCEVYSCNQSNTASLAGIQVAVMATLTRCIAHDNTGSNTVGILHAGGTTSVLTMIGCISETNGSHGLNVSASGPMNIYGCDFYNNTGDGVRLTTAINPVMISNSNFIKNGGYGINGNSGNKLGLIFNCGYGAGTQVNTSGATNATSGIVESGAVTYGSNLTPWVAPTTGDFRINLAAAKNAGYGVYTETAPSYTGTIGYPDIGAAQHLDSATTGGGSFTFS